MQKILHSALLFLFAGVLACAAQSAFQPDQVFTNELNNVRALLRSQQPSLATNQLDELAVTLARSNRLAQLLPELIFQLEFTDAAALLKEFPGNIDDRLRFAL